MIQGSNVETICVIKRYKTNTKDLEKGYSTNESGSIGSFKYENFKNYWAL